MLTLHRPQRSIARRPSLFGDFFDDMFAPAWNGETFRFANTSPAVDLIEHEKTYEIHADLPGFDEKDIEVTLSEGVLAINARRESDKDEKHNGFKLRERYQGSYSRRFRLGSKVSSDGIEATYKQGVLNVVIPKAPETMPRQIPVSVN